MPDEAALVAAQVGRPPRDPWRVAARCSYDFPTVIASPPRLADGEPFPTLFWLTCPWLVAAVSDLESAGAAADWAARLEREPELCARAEAADAEYRRLRAAEGGGDDPCADTGVAGQARVTGTKCLHAYVAASLAGLDDPAGAAMLAHLTRECPDGRCARLPGAGAGPRS